MKPRHFFWIVCLSRVAWAEPTLHSEVFDTCSQEQCRIFEVVVRNLEYKDVGAGTLVAVDGTKCSKTAMVPAPVFGAVSKVMESIANNPSLFNGTGSLSPAQQTILLFYTSIMQQTQGFECGQHVND